MGPRRIPNKTGPKRGKMGGEKRAGGHLKKINDFKFEMK